MIRHGKVRKSVVAIATAAAAIVVLAGTALAGHQTSGVKSYTGCLVSGDGVMIKIKEGEAPRSPCTGGQVQAHFSGGDITKISVGNGLSLPNGGDNGAVEIRLDASHSLPQDCAQFEVPMKKVSAGWACANHDVGTGLGMDRTLGASGGTVAFRILADYQVKNDPDCLAGEYAYGFESNGTIKCSTPPKAQGDMRSVHVPSHTFAGPGFEKLGAITLPEGVWMLTARTDLQWSGGSDEFTASVACELRAGTSVLAGAQDEEWNEDAGSGFVGNPRGRATLTVIDVESVPQAGQEIGLWCLNAGGTVGDVGDYGADLVAVAVG